MQFITRETLNKYVGDKSIIELNVFIELIEQEFGIVMLDEDKPTDEQKRRTHIEDKDEDRVKNRPEEWEPIGQGSSPYEALLEEALELRERAEELMSELIDKNDQLSAWDVIETLDKAMQGRDNIDLLKRVIDESTETVNDLELM